MIEQVKDTVFTIYLFWQVGIKSKKNSDSFNDDNAYLRNNSMKVAQQQFLSNLRDSLDRCELIQEVDKYFRILEHSDWIEVWSLFRQDLNSQEEEWVVNSLWEWVGQKFL